MLTNSLDYEFGHGTLGMAYLESQLGKLDWLGVTYRLVLESSGDFVHMSGAWSGIA